MATQKQLPEFGSEPASAVSNRDLRDAIIGIAIALVAVVALFTVDHSSVWFPLITGVAFPALALSPFILLRIKIPLIAKIVRIGIIGIIVVPILGLRDTDYLELAVQISI